MNLNFKQPNSRVLEVILVLVTLVLTCVLYQTVGYKIIVLNLFYPPVILAAFFLGRYRAGVLAFFSVLAASIVLSFNLGEFAAYDSPLIVALSVLVWGGVLGLAALLVGTLSDELASRMTELHEAHVGVVEVLSHYLQSAHPSLKDHSHRVASICRQLAEHLKLGQKEVDDIRVAALLCDMENIEITARVIRKAIGDLGEEQKPGGQHTFHGTELVQSLGPALLGAFPLVLNQSSAEQQRAAGGAGSTTQVPLGARIYSHGARLRRVDAQQMGTAQHHAGRRHQRTLARYRSRARPDDPACTGTNRHSRQPGRADTRSGRRTQRIDACRSDLTRQRDSHPFFS
jgi:hypothetical protein